MKYRTDLLGFKTRRTSKGALVVEIDLEADPRKRDPKWQASMRRRMPSHAHWRREFLRDWGVSTGAPFYPEFLLRPEIYIKKLDTLLDLPVLRGFDFGIRKAAICWAQYAPRSNRLWVVRELMPEGIDTHSLAILTRYLSGQETLDEAMKYAGAARYIQWIESESKKDPIRMPPPPWFNPSTRFIDYAGPEVFKRTATIEGESAERTDMAVFSRYGIQLNILTASVASREVKIRALLHVRGDGVPGLLLDPACDELTKGFQGGLSYKKPVPSDPLPNESVRDGHYEHIFDALGYVVLNVVPLDLGIDGGEYEVSESEDGFDSKEMDGGPW